MLSFFKRKKKSDYPRSFAGRLTWRIILTQLIVMGLTTLLVAGTLWVIGYAQVNLFCDKLVDIKKDRIEHTLSEVSIAAVNTIPSIEQNLGNPEHMFKIVEDIVRLNPRVRSCGISFIDNYYPKKGHWYCPYAIRRDSDQVELRKVGNYKQNYLKSEWFNEALKASEGYWAKAFFDGIDSTSALVAYVAPIRNQKGEAVAVLGVDLSLDFLNDDTYINKVAEDGNNNWDAYHKMYFFVIDSTGRYLIHPDKQRILRQNFLTRVKESPNKVDDLLADYMVNREDNSINSDEENKNDLFIEGEQVTVYYSPVENTDWSLAFVMPQLFINVLVWLLVGLLLAFIIMGLLVVFFASRRGIKKISKPLIQLAHTADEVAKGNFETHLPTINSHDEIHQLRDSFENMQQSLTRYMIELQDTTAQKASIESELKIAHNIQMSMLPKLFPPYPERSDIDIYGQLRPAKAVGGDLFDFFISDEKLFFCIGDVSGKGVPASLVMAVTRSLFRNVSSHLVDPNLIVKALNESQCDGNDMDMFVTLFVGVFNLQTGILYYCNAGHDAPLLIGQGVGQLPCDSNLPIGVMRDWNYTLQQVKIEPQTTIFLYTDGLNEAEDIKHIQFGDERIIRLAETLLDRGQQQPDKLIELMGDAVRDFVGDAEQSDDLTMLAIQYKKETTSE